MKNIISFSALIYLSLNMLACSSGTDDDGGSSDGSNQQIDENDDGSAGGIDAGDGSGGSRDGSQSTGGQTAAAGGSGGTGQDASGGGGSDDPSHVPLELIEGPGQTGRYCLYESEALVAGTTIFSPDGCTRCTCQEDGIECWENWECADGKLPASCEGLSHRQSRVSQVDNCQLIELCADGQISSTQGCTVANGPSGCSAGDLQFQEGERMSDGSDGGACYCAGGEATCLF